MFDLFWKDDISILYNVDRLTEFFPSSDMNFDEKPNALVRLCTYAGILLYLYKFNLLTWFCRPFKPIIIYRRIFFCYISKFLSVFS